MMEENFSCVKGQSRISSPPEYLLRSACQANSANTTNKGRTLTAINTSSSTHQAVVCQELGKPLVTKTVPVQGLKNTEVQVDAQYCGINYADILRCMGKYQERSEPPFIPGCESAGTIADVGRDVTQFQKGDRVIALMRTGGYGQKVNAKQTMTFKLPDNVSYKDAVAAVASYGTAHMALTARANTQPGDIVLVSGASGGVGLAAVEIAAKVIGATVIAIAGDDKKLALTKEMGATYLINHRKQDVRKEILAITNKKGVDVFIDNVGGDMFKVGLRCIAFEGRVVCVGFASGSIPVIPANILLVKNISVFGIFWSNYEIRNYEKFDMSVKTILQLCSEGKIRPYFSAEFPFDKVNEAFKFILSRKSTGKVILYPNH